MRKTSCLCLWTEWYTRAPNGDKRTERDRFFWWTVLPLKPVCEDRRGQDGQYLRLESLSSQPAERPNKTTLRLELAVRDPPSLVQWRLKHHKGSHRLHFFVCFFFFCADWKRRRFYLNRGSKPPWDLYIQPLTAREYIKFGYVLNCVRKRSVLNWRESQER